MGTVLKLEIIEKVYQPMILNSRKGQKVVATKKLFGQRKRHCCF